MRFWLCAALVVSLLTSLDAAELMVRLRGERLQVAARNFHFLSGKSLERIRNGESVAFDFHLAVLSNPSSLPLRRAFERFVVSYDLWEEKYSVSRMRSRQGMATHLTLAAAESFCLENISVPVSGLPDEPLVARLEIRAQLNSSEELFSDPGLSLSQLIEIFSRARRSPRDDFWRLESAPFRLSGLDRAPLRNQGK